MNEILPSVTQQVRTYHTQSPEETRALGRQLGRLLRGGEVIALIGDLGAGKTTFAQGIVQGMGSRDRVTSPTFTLVNVYRADSLEVHHVDAYRLAGPGGVVSADEVAGLALDELMGDSKFVLLVEWADVAPSLLREATLAVTFPRDDASDAGFDDAPDETRTIVMTSAAPDFVFPEG